MLKWSQDLYIGDEIFDSFGEIREKLERGEPVMRAWLLTKPANPANQLEIMNCRYLVQELCREFVPEIIGMALDRREAVRMILLITEACVERTDTADLRAFLETSPDIPGIHHVIENASQIR